MTVIVGLLDGDDVLMGADSMVSNEETWMTPLDPKVFVVDDFLFGVGGSCRLMDVLRSSGGFWTPSRDGVPPEDFIRSVFVPDLQRLLELRDFKMEAGWEFLIGFRGSLFQVQGDLSILRLNSATAGSGETAAAASLHTTGELSYILTAQERVELALRAAEAVVPSVRGPFTVLRM